VNSATGQAGWAAIRSPRCDGRLSEANVIFSQFSADTASSLGLRFGLVNPERQGQP